MKLKFLFLLLAIASLFSFVFGTNTSVEKVKESKVSIESLQLDKEPMQPFVLMDRNQFD